VREEDGERECVRVCERERDRLRERAGWREREREGERQSETDCLRHVSVLRIVSPTVLTYEGAPRGRETGSTGERGRVRDADEEKDKEKLALPPVPFFGVLSSSTRDHRCRPYGKKTVRANVSRAIRSDFYRGESSTLEEFAIFPRISPRDPNFAAFPVVFSPDSESGLTAFLVPPCRYIRGG